MYCCVCVCCDLLHSTSQRRTNHIAPLSHHCTPPHSTPHAHATYGAESQNEQLVTLDVVDAPMSREFSIKAHISTGLETRPGMPMFGEGKGTHDFFKEIGAYTRFRPLPGPEGAFAPSPVAGTADHAFGGLFDTYDVSSNGRSHAPYNIAYAMFDGSNPPFVLANAEDEDDEDDEFQCLCASSHPPCWSCERGFSEKCPYWKSESEKRAEQIGFPSESVASEALDFYQRAGVRPGDVLLCVGIDTHRIGSSTKFLLARRVDYTVGASLDESAGEEGEEGEEEE